MTDKLFTVDDIGPKLIEYVTEGLYESPYEVLREYIQNAVDSRADNLEVKVRVLCDNVFIEDNGLGMNHSELERSIRIARSDKNPVDNVGHKGIGIYSGYMIAERLVVTTINDDQIYQLVVDFEKMNQLINTPAETQDEKEENDETDDTETIPRNIPDILNACLTIKRIDSLESVDQEYKPSSLKGTMAVLENISENARKDFKYDELKSFIETTVPLNFHPDFSLGNKIIEGLNEKAVENGFEFKTVDLTLEVNEKKSNLYRPFLNQEKKPLLNPEFHDIRNPNNEDELFGVAWSSLSQENFMLHKSFRGFLLKKQGFTIGDNKKMLEYFNHVEKYFNRYIGEFIITSNKIQPNSARDGLKPGDSKRLFDHRVKQMCEKLHRIADVRQETNKALEDIEIGLKLLEEFKIEQSKANKNKLLDKLQELIKRLPNKNVEDDVLVQVKSTIAKIESYIKEVDDASSDDDQPDGNGGQTNGNGGQSTGNEGDGQSGGNNQPGGAEDGDQPDSDDKTDDGQSTDAADDAGKTSGGNGIPFSEQVHDIIEKMNKDGKNSKPQARKIKSLHSSLSKVPLNTNPVLMYIGTWSLWEIIGKSINKSLGVKKSDPYAELSNFIGQVYKDYHSDHVKAIKLSLENINRFGNCNKHADKFFAETGIPLKNEMENLDHFLVHALTKVHENLKPEPQKNNN